MKELLENQDALNPKSMNYVPTYEEMKLPRDLIRRLETEYMDDLKSEKNNKELDYYMAKYQLAHRNKLIIKEKISASKKSLKLSSHWYNTLQPKEIEDLIERSRPYTDQVIDELIERVKTSWELNYLEQLRIRIKAAPIILSPAADSKLKRFPNYSMGTNELHGSAYTFYKLWAHVFKSHKRTGRIIIKGK